jgi:hypothetical protein
METRKHRPGIDDYYPGDLREYIENHQRETRKMQGEPEEPAKLPKPFSYRIERIIAGHYRFIASNGREYHIGRDFNRGKPSGWEWKSTIFQTPYEREGGFGTFKQARDHLIKRLTQPQTPL